MATAKIIADSVSEQGVRITTMELEFPRYILPQFNTHRMFSRNAQSSRAIPVSKLLQQVKESKPPIFAENIPGMQEGEVLPVLRNFLAEMTWGCAKFSATTFARILMKLNVHKQWANRLLEPFSTVKVLVTATEWDNFFALRLHHDAQPEMQELACAMKRAMDDSYPQLLKCGEWHLPYISDFEKGGGQCCDELARISAARCARVSYLNHNKSRPKLEYDLLRARELKRDNHWSPFEHQAKPMFRLDIIEEGATHSDTKLDCWSGNFRGWIQHRHLVS